MVSRDNIEQIFGGTNSFISIMVTMEVCSKSKMENSREATVLA